MAECDEDFAIDPMAALIESPSESFDAWLEELLGDPPVKLDTTSVDLGARARLDEA